MTAKGTGARRAAPVVPTASSPARRSPPKADHPDLQIDDPERGPGQPWPLPLERHTVDVDTWIDRPDLPPGSRTFVAAGENIPPELVDFAREPAG